MHKKVICFRCVVGNKGIDMDLLGRIHMRIRGIHKFRQAYRVRQGKTKVGRNLQARNDVVNIKICQRFQRSILDKSVFDSSVLVISIFNSVGFTCAGVASTGFTCVGFSNVGISDVGLRGTAYTL